MNTGDRGVASHDEIGPRAGPPMPTWDRNGSFRRHYTSDIANDVPRGGPADISTRMAPGSGHRRLDIDWRQPSERADVRFFAERQRPIHFSLSAVVAAFSRRFGRTSEPLIFCRFGAIIFSWTHAFPLPVVGRERAQCLSATDGPDFFLILVVCLIWGRPIPIASRMRTLRTPRNVRGPLLTNQFRIQGAYSKAPK